MRKLVLSKTLFLAALILGFAAATSVQADDTAFTYQGRLDIAGTPANGAFDLQLAVFESVSGSNMIGNSNVISELAITNGLFTATLDPSSNVFDGSPRWLQIGVRPAGDTNIPFTVLQPRQRILPAPQAIYAGNAGVASSVITGGVAAVSIAAGQVVKNVNGLTDTVSLNAGNNISLTTTNNDITIHTAAGLLSWETVSASSFTAKTNHGYLLTSNPRPTLTLPSAPNLADIIRIAGSGTNGWKVAQNAGQSIRLRNLPGNVGINWTPRNSLHKWSAIASSADGNKLVAADGSGQLYTSTDGGTNWTARDSIRSWSAVASSEFGVFLVAAVNGGYLYVSTNSGVSWTARVTDAPRNWVSVCCSADGSTMVAGNSGGYNHISYDNGVTWTLYSGAPGGKLACSWDGARVVVAVNGAGIYTSSDSGQTWTLRTSTASAWSAVACSADGSKLVATVNNGQIYVSSDYGVSWTARDSVRAWNGVSSSADGSRLATTVNGGQIYNSLDSGVTWAARENNRAWTAIASSADGTRLAATVNGAQIYTSDNVNPTTTIGTAGYLIGEPGAALELQYIGGNQFIPLSHEGFIGGY